MNKLKENLTLFINMNVFLLYTYEIIKIKIVSNKQKCFKITKFLIYYEYYKYVLKLIKESKIIIKLMNIGKTNIKLFIVNFFPTSTVK